jgi:hypothetical protein
MFFLHLLVHGSLYNFEAHCVLFELNVTLFWMQDLVLKNYLELNFFRIIGYHILIERFIASKIDKLLYSTG